MNTKMYVGNLYSSVERLPLTKHIFAKSGRKAVVNSAAVAVAAVIAMTVATVGAVAKIAVVAVAQTAAIGVATAIKRANA